MVRESACLSLLGAASATLPPPTPCWPTTRAMANSSAILMVAVVVFFVTFSLSGSARSFVSLRPTFFFPQRGPGLLGSPVLHYSGALYYVLNSATPLVAPRVEKYQIELPLPSRFVGCWDCACVHFSALPTL